jgi:dTDP-glucose 4,6-dehydratase
MRILVTGGLGFIGSALIRKLLNDNDLEILNIDKCSYASMPEALEERDNQDNYNFQKIDITNAQDVDKVIHEFKPNKIFHLAAESHVDRSIDGPEDFLQTNIMGTFNILEAVRKNQASLPEDFILIHVSTDEVFGSLQPEEALFIESSLYKPNSPYSASKASSDLLVRAWNKTYGIKSVITNCSNNYGPWQNPEKLIPKIIFNAISGNIIPIYGNGKNIRDWLHVNDHVDALIAASNSSGLFNRYTIGANQEMSNIELTKMICDYLDEVRPKEVSYFNQVEFVKDRLGHDLRYAINSSHISETLGFNPKFDILSGIKETVDWYLQNNNWVIQKEEAQI